MNRCRTCSLCEGRVDTEESCAQTHALTSAVGVVPDSCSRAVRTSAVMDDIKSIQADVSQVIEAHRPRPRQDAVAERARATFSVPALAAYVNDGAENVTKR